MPTFNQLVRSGREKREYKSKSPVLQKNLNTLTKSYTDLSAPQRRGVCTKVTTPRNCQKTFIAYSLLPSRIFSSGCRQPNSSPIRI